jgi:hypothetical protein
MKVCLRVKPSILDSYPAQSLEPQAWPGGGYNPLPSRQPRLAFHCQARKRLPVGSL